jgi:hypothetical protein
MDHRTHLMHHSREELIGLLEDAARNWLAHDGLWFLAAEEAFGMEAAIRLDIRAWEQFTVIEARRIMQRLGLAPGGGLEALEKALGYRLYAYINRQETIRVDEHTLLFRMNECHVQAARQRKGLPDFPCKPVGLVEYAGFARAIDPRISTRCVVCPPDLHPAEYWCAWEFSLDSNGHVASPPAGVGPAHAQPVPGNATVGR